MRAVCLAILFLVAHGTSARATTTLAPPAATDTGYDLELQICISATENATGIASYQHAAASCTVVVQRAGNDLRSQTIALTLRGVNEASLQETQPALADFDAALTIAPDFVLALRGQAMMLLNSGANQKAVDAYSHLIQFNPADAKLYVGRGDAHNNLREYTSGIADFNQALKLDPTDAEAMNDRAWAFAREGRWAEALHGYDAALAVPSDMRDTIYENHSEAQAMLGNFTAANADCITAAKLAPRTAQSFECFGLVELIQKNYKEAAKEYSAALAVSSQDGGALYARGIAKMELGDTVNGAKEVAAGQALAPYSRDFYTSVGITPPAGP